MFLHRVIAETTFLKINPLPLNVFFLTSVISSILQLVQQILYSTEKHGNWEESIGTKWVNKSQPAFTCSNSTVETPEQCVQFFQGSQKRHQNNINNIVLVSLLLTLSRFPTFLRCSHYWLWTSECRLSRLGWYLFSYLY